MTKKKILFVTQRDCYPFFVGGAEISAHTLLSHLQLRGHKCLALGTLGRNLEDLEKYTKMFEVQSTPYEFISETVKLASQEIPKELFMSINVGYEVKLTLLNNFTKFFNQHASVYKPDLIITQMMGSGLAVRFSYNNKIPCAHLIRDINTLYNLEPLFLEPEYLGYPDFFSNSKYMQREFKKKYEKDSLVLYPSVNLAEYSFKNGIRKHITFVNPNNKKGGQLFVKIAKKLPQLKFLVVEGWDKIGDNSPLRRLKNVTIKERQYMMTDVYDKTKILIAPSVWQEAFARVVIEAQVSGVPVIASKHSGLIESVGDGGILVDKYLDPEAWAIAINNLYKNGRFYNVLSGKARQNSEKFDVSKTAAEFCKRYGL